MKNHPIHALAFTFTTLALGSIQASAQTIWNGSVDNDMSNLSNYTGTGNPRTWNGTQAGDLNLTVSTAFAAQFKYLSAQTGSVTVDGAAKGITHSNTGSIFELESGAGAVTWSNMSFQQGSNTASDFSFTFRNNSANNLVFTSSVNFTRTGSVTDRRSLTFDGTGVVRVEGTINNMGNTATLTKSNSGTLVLSGDNIYAGPTTISGGTLIAGHANALGTSTTVSSTTVANGAQLRLNPASGNITYAAEALTISGTGVSTGGALRNAAGNNTWQGKVTLGAAATIGAAIDTMLTLDVASGNAIEAADFSLTFDGAGTNQVNDPISLGAGGLTKTGSGTTVLSASNSYSGNTAVELGTLTITQPYLADAASVSLGASAVLNLNFDESGGNVTDTVDTLFINGVQQPAGVYGATDSGATTVNNVNFAGAGTLTVTNGPTFSLWITGFGLAVADQEPGDDPDNDGISNLVEYAIAGQNPTVGNPTIGTFAANLLSFTKRGGAIRLTYAIVESTDLGITDDWTEVSGGGYVNNATTISYTLTPSTPAKNFARLKVTQIP